MTHAVLTVLGSDRPGLTQALADAVLAAGGNWLESHLSHLGGRFAGSVLVEIDPLRLKDLEAAAHAIGEALEVRVAAATPTARAPTEALAFKIMGSDRPGIVRQIAAALAALHVNIDELETRTEIEPHAGGRLFHATARVSLPQGLSAGEVASALEDISVEIMVDLEIS